MDIGQAVAELKQGKMVRRAGWNGKGMHVYMEDKETFNLREGAFKGQTRTTEAYLCLFTAAGTHQPGWNASTPDLLANDWELAE